MLTFYETRDLRIFSNFLDLMKKLITLVKHFKFSRILWEEEGEGTIQI